MERQQAQEGPSRGKLVAGVVAFALFGTAVAWGLIDRYNERPPWGTDIAYEGGYVQAVRIAKVRPMRDGECEEMERMGMGGERATHAPEAWVAGCLDGAAGRPSTNQGFVR
ncbi:hypothetical protein [Streptomyces sp. NPDC058579]|uniref:hypothetical protein n=1 Tax=Streptomyces sp. NPDC058579 TaxID=3346548 RepID=UPI00364ABF09